MLRGVRAGVGVGLAAAVVGWGDGIVAGCLAFEFCVGWFVLAVVFELTVLFLTSAGDGVDDVVGAGREAASLLAVCSSLS